LDRVKKCPPKFFEKLVVDLLVSMGYGGSRKDAGQAIGQSGDDGIDGIIKEDKLAWTSFIFKQNDGKRPSDDPSSKLLLAVWRDSEPEKAC
jgi:restriction endonuclease Mrr